MEEIKSDPQPLPESGATTQNGCRLGRFLPIGRPNLTVTSEYDSDTSIFFHKLSCKLLNNLGKLKVSFQNNSKGQVADPQLSFHSRFFSLQYDIEENDALLKTSFDVSPRLHFRAVHEVKARQSEVAVVADLAGPAYKLELSTLVPSVGLPKASFKFPLGEVSFQEREVDEEEEEELQKRGLSVNAIVKTNFLNGVCTARYNEDDFNLRYAFKDEQMTFIPSISLPTNSVSCTFKRRISPSVKLSYMYYFDSNNWSVVYKHTVGKDYKLKSGYDSQVGLGWASLWIGDEDGQAKTAPLKMKWQIMLQVPQTDISCSALMFRVKKRWDI